MNATGDAKNVPPGHLWTVVEVTGPEGHPSWDLLKQTTPRIWPGPAAIQVSPDGKWEAPIIFGANDPKQSGLVFRLSLVATDTNVAQLFEQYNRTAQQQQYSGLPKSTANTGLKILHEVTVSRK